jgi:hypothetical protein
MFCNGCGVQLEDGAAVCGSCGTPAPPNASMVAPPPLQEASLPTSSPPPPPPPPSFAAPPVAYGAQHLPSAPSAPPGSAVAKEPLPSGARNRALVLLVGGAVLAIGALLPWETATGPLGSTSVKGPSLLLVCGLVISLLAFLLFSSNVKRGAAIVTLVVAAVSLVDAIGNTSAASDDVNTAKDLGVDAALGAGAGLAIVGALMAGIASVLFLRATRAGGHVQNPLT